MPKNSFSIALALADKIDTLVGFFGIDQKPTSSKDPYALRRLALGVVRLLIENNKDFKIKDLINYSSLLHYNQGFKLSNTSLQKDLNDFLLDRFKYYMKEKNIRIDIINSIIISSTKGNLIKNYQKGIALNKIITKSIGIDIISSYNRASNILEHELRNKKIEISNTTDPGIFKNEYEKNLLRKINELRKYLSNVDGDENNEKTLKILADAKPTISEFFDNVKVNDEDQSIKKNRLELLQMLCKTFDNYINFSNIEIN